MIGSAVVDEDPRNQTPNIRFLPLAELARSVGRFGKHHVYYDYQVREPNAVSARFVADLARTLSGCMSGLS